MTDEETTKEGLDNRVGFTLRTSRGGSDEEG